MILTRPVVELVQRAEMTPGTADCALVTASIAKSDKSGRLTSIKMELTKVYSPDSEIVTGDSDKPTATKDPVATVAAVAKES